MQPKQGLNRALNCKPGHAKIFQEKILGLLHFWNNSVGQLNCKCLSHLIRVISPILSRKPGVWFICQNPVFNLTYLCNCRQYPGDCLLKESETRGTVSLWIFRRCVKIITLDAHRFPYITLFGSGNWAFRKEICTQHTWFRVFFKEDVCLSNDTSHMTSLPRTTSTVPCKLWWEKTIPKK